MGNIRFGHREGPGRGREVPLVAAQYFHNKGGHFVKLSLDGNASLCATGDALVFGWAETPKATTGYNAWKSSDTAEADKVFVIYGLEDVFELPVDEANSKMAASFLGQGAGLVNKGTTYTIIQHAKIGGNVTASPVTIVDYDLAASTVFVKIKSSKKLG